MRKALSNRNSKLIITFLLDDMSLWLHLYSDGAARAYDSSAGKEYESEAFYIIPPEAVSELRLYILEKNKQKDSEET